MKHEGPPLEQLTHRLAECPPEFLEEPRVGATGIVHVAAVVNDLLVALGKAPNDASWAAEFMPGADPQHALTPETATGAPSLMDRLISKLSGSESAPAIQANERDWLRCVLVGCWLINDAWFLQQKNIVDAVRRFLTGELRELSKSTQATKLVGDPDRREELARLCLKALDYRPKGESPEQAQDRLATLNTTERMRLLKAVREAEKRAKEIREAMAKKAAEEAAAKYNRE